MTSTDPTLDIERLLAEDETDLDHLDEAWDALAAGTLSAAEAAALAESDPLAAEAFAPLSEGFSERIRAELAVIPPPRAPERARRWWWLPRLLLACTVLLSARIGMVALSPTPPLPDYQLKQRTGELPTRSAQDKAPLTLSEGSRMRLILRPETLPEAATQAVVYVRGGDGWQRLHLAVTTENGAHRIEGIVGEELHLAPGEHTLLIGVGPAGPLGLLERALPVRGWRATLSADTLESAEPPPQWTFFQQPVVISAP